MKKHWILFISGSLLGVGIFTFLYFSHFGLATDIRENIAEYLLSILVSVSILYTFLGLNQILDKYLSWEKFFIIRFSISTLSGMIASVLILGVIVSAYFMIFSSYEIQDLNSVYGDEGIKLSILLFLIALIFNAGYFGFYSYRQYTHIQISRVAQDRKQLRLQFEALKSQLSPHYLFNSLNTISSLVYKDASAAEEFIRRLALTFKYVITTDNKKLVPLNEEVEFIKSYYHLLKVRFGNSLNLNINLPDSILSTVIPPLTLQILVENAVKHNQFNTDNRLEIYVGAIDNQFLKVTNNKLIPAENVLSFHVGLDNIKKRYSFYSDTDIRVDNDNKFAVQLPVLNTIIAS